MIAVYKYGGVYFVEPVLDIRDGEVLIRLQRNVAWVKPFDVVHEGEDPLRHVSDEYRCEINFAAPIASQYAGQSILKPSAADERREQEAWEAECHID